MSVAQEPLISKTPAWQALRAHQARMADVHMRALFDEDARRAARFSLEDAGLYLDYSKNRIVAETLPLLHDLAHTARLGHAIGRMFAGERINTTEGRAVLHTAGAPRRDTGRGPRRLHAGAHRALSASCPRRPRAALRRVTTARTLGCEQK
ncbi:MAG: hypothetical protein ACREXX_14290 [Gammaproteobacteria bacterium]